jgi:hypothetical protein
MRALTELVRDLDLSRCLLIIDTAELLYLFDEVGVERSGVRAETHLGLTRWFLHDLVPELVDAGPGIRLVLAGRERFTVDEPWFHQLELSEWSAGETAQFLANHGLVSRK